MFIDDSSVLIKKSIEINKLHSLDIEQRNMVNSIKLSFESFMVIISGMTYPFFHLTK